MSKVEPVDYDEKTRQYIDAMIESEEHDLAARRAAEGDGTGAECPCQEGMFPTRAPSRRRFLFAAGSTVGAGAVGLLGARAAVAAD